MKRIFFAFSLVISLLLSGCSFSFEDGIFKFDNDIQKGIDADVATVQIGAQVVRVDAIELDLSNCSLTNDDISALEKLKSLQHLKLSHNNITDISVLVNCENLETLDIEGNKIEDFSYLAELHKLTELNLSKTDIKDLTFLKKLTNLSVLDLSDNSITEFQFVKDLSKLKELNLSGNNLATEAVSKIEGMVSDICNFIH